MKLDFHTKIKIISEYFPKKIIFYGNNIWKIHTHLNLYSWMKRGHFRKSYKRKFKEFKKDPENAT